MVLHGLIIGLKLRVGQVVDLKKLPEAEAVAPDEAPPAFAAQGDPPDPVLREGLPGTQRLDPALQAVAGRMVPRDRFVHQMVRFLEAPFLQGPVEVGGCRRQNLVLRYQG